MRLRRLLVFTLAVLPLLAGSAGALKPPKPPKPRKPHPVRHTKRVVVKARPPAPRVVVRTPAPSPRHVHIDGYWRWDDGKRDFLWIDPVWMLPPVGLSIWVPGHWDASDDGWEWVEGHWSK